MELYFYIVALSALESLALVVIILYRNSGRMEGWLCASTAFAIALWLFGVAHYFLPMSEGDALWWARLTLTGAVLIPAWFYHSLCALGGVQRQQRYFIIIAHFTTLAWVAALWTDFLDLHIIKGSLAFDHYIEVRRFFWLMLVQIVGWIAYTTYLMVRIVRQLAGYKRQQILYLIFITVSLHLTTSTVLMPIQYGWKMPPYGMILMPIELGLLGYAFSRVRLMDFSQAASRVFIFAVTMVIAVLAALIPISFTTLIKKDFFTDAQIFFIVWLVSMVAFGVAYVIPRIAPLVEQRIRERLFSQRYGYQRAMLDVIGKLSTLPDANSMLDRALDACLEHMGVQWAAVFLEDDVLGTFVLRAERPTGVLLGVTKELPHNSAIVSWLRDASGAIVREELTRTGMLTVNRRLRPTIEEMDRIGATLVAPLVHKDWVAGFVATSNRRSGEMFTVMDVELLETLGRETAIALHHRRKENQIMRSERLITLGAVASGIAHEIRNPLASIGTFASLMAEKGDDPKFREEFGKIVSADVERINKVVTTVLAFSRQSNVDTQVCNINETVEQALQLLRPTIKNKVVPIATVLQRVPEVRVNTHQIIQILLNLAGNAVEAVPQSGGKVKVSTYVLGTDRSAPKSRSPNYVIVEVADNGPGIPDNIQERLFQPFFTTKKSGTGLGLAISQKIANDHGGFILLESKVGQGAVFKLHLPIAQSEQIV